MKLAVMQPYFLPYIGYFQLMAAVDRFVVYDDVNYIKGGWINRNRHLAQNAPRLFTVPLIGASPNRRINEISVDNSAHWRTKLLRTLQHAYHDAPFFAPVQALVEDIVCAPHAALSAYLLHSLQALHDFLGLSCTLVSTSSGYGNAHLNGQARILDICRQEQADIYVNLPGGRSLYDHSAFAAQGIDLRFVDVPQSVYPQLGQPFVPQLSILDVLMFNGAAGTRELLLEATPS